MIRNPPTRLRRVALAAAAVALVAMACGGDPAAEPPPAEPAARAPEPASSPPEPPTETAAPSPPPESPPEPPPEPESLPAEPLEILVDADTVWRDVFDALGAAERSCIRSEVGDDVLDSLLERPLASETDTEEWEVSIFTCLTPDNARSLFLAGMIAGLQEGMDMGELGDEEMSCLRDLVAELDVATLVAEEYAGDDSTLLEVGTVLIGCVPDLFLGPMLADMGVDVADLREDEVDCLRDWMSSVDWAAVGSAESDAESFSALEANLLDLFNCLTEGFGEPGSQDGGAGDHADRTDEATALPVGEPVQGALDHFGDLDFYTFEAVEGEAYLVEVTLESLEDSVLSLYDADGWELAFNDDRDEESFGSLISWTAPESGSYYVEVGSYDGSGLGSYTLSVTTE
ncbi:MAG: PPC domain-containing protein [Acidimicrobiia bacterium]|nr:PPC domain-containing protein [Acidimicrobiia bacterium]